jgi:hypothetical protein
VIVWLNGTFGAGKTTTAKLLTDLLPGSRIFDAETVGQLLRHVLTEPVYDFRDWPPWRALVIEGAVQIQRFTDSTLIVPQTLLEPEYAQEIFDGLRANHLPVYHVLLHAHRAELARRIDHDEGGRESRRWRLDHLPGYETALPWLEKAADVTVDTTLLDPADVAVRVAEHVGAS